MNDRLAEIEARKEWRHNGTMNAPDALWLMEEVLRLRRQADSIRHRLAEAMHRVVFNSDNTFDLLASVLHQRHGAMTELNDIHDILAEALGYSQDALDDPESPCPGAWVTGDHTAASLALEAAKTLKDRGETIETLSRAGDRVRGDNTQLEQQLEMAQDRIRDIQRARQIAVETATEQIIELQRELAELRDTKKGQLRRELAARKENCCCVFQDEGIDEGRLLPHPDCREHGVEANDRRLAGEKAVSTLQYVRKYFMGSDHGYEV
jgi:DNA repair exonuclease SbcCD ATPase subunit